MSSQISFGRVWKRYSLRSRRRRIRQAVHDWLEARRTGESHAAQDFWALQGVTLNIAHGDSLGIVGDNGTGKSTLLKLISGVTYPTQGQVTVRGRVGALVDVGAGMHPDLTGSENIYLYGTILGLLRREIRQRFDEIVGFSEISTFLDVPLKRYSSGMKVRLGFAVAAFLDPDILLLDEVLAVGDVAFQRKCVERIRTLQRGGSTIIFVSHSLSTVEQICRQAVWMKEGQIHEIGDSAEVIGHYRASIEQRFVNAARRAVTGNGSIEVERVVLTDREGSPRLEFHPREDVIVNVRYRSGGQAIHTPIVFLLKVVDPAGRTLILSNSGARMLPTSGSYETVRCRIDSIPLTPSTYQVWGQVLRLPDRNEEIPWQPIAAFTVTNSSLAASGHAFTIHPHERAILEIPARWSVHSEHAASPDDAEQPNHQTNAQSPNLE